MTVVGWTGGPAASALASNYTTTVTERFDAATFAPTSNLAFDPTTNTCLEAATQGIFRVGAGRTSQTLITPYSNATDGTGTGSAVYGIAVNTVLNDGSFAYASNAGLSGGVGGLVVESGAGTVSASVALSTSTAAQAFGYGVYYAPSLSANGALNYVTASGAQNGYGAVLHGANFNSSAHNRATLAASVGTNAHTNLAADPNASGTFYGVATMPGSDASNLFTAPASGGRPSAALLLGDRAISGLTFVASGTAFGTTRNSVYDIPNAQGGVGNTAVPLLPLTASTTGVQSAGQQGEPQLVAFDGAAGNSDVLFFSEPTSAGGTTVINVVQVDANNVAVDTAIPLDPGDGSRIVSLIADSFVLHTTTVGGTTVTTYDATVDVVTDTTMFTLDFTGGPEPTSLLMVVVATAPLTLGRCRRRVRGPGVPMTAEW